MNFLFELAFKEILGYKIITLEGKKAEQKETQTSMSGQDSNKYKH